MSKHPYQNKLSCGIVKSSRGQTVCRFIICIRKEIVMQKFINAKLASAIANAVSIANKSVKAMTSAVDLMVAEGLKSTDFISPKGEASKSTSSAEQFEEINAAIVAGFTPATQKLLDTPTKALTESGKHNKRYAQQQIGARRNDFKRALEKREAILAGTTSQTRTLDEWCRDMANDGIKKCRSAEDAPFEIEAMIKALNTVLTIAKR